MIHVIFPQEGETWSTFTERIVKYKKDLIVIISGQRDTELLHAEKQCQKCLQTIAQRPKKTYLATHNSTLVTLARARGIDCITKSKTLKELLRGHPQYQEAIREFLPQVWRQHLRSRLQSMGLLSLPKVRIWILVGISIIAFLFTLAKLLPGAEITVIPRQETIVQTSNIFLVQSGAVLTDIPERVRSIALVPIRTSITKTLTFDGVGKEFLGTSARLTMEVYNETDEPYSLRSGSRLANNAGIVFLTEEVIAIDPGETVQVPAVAADIDLYNEIIGERGNVPEGLRWEFIGLSSTAKRLVYAKNVTPGEGGETSHRLVYTVDDLPLAKTYLEQKLLEAANQDIEQHIEEYNLANEGLLTRLYYEELQSYEFSNFALAEEFVGQAVTTVPITGTVTFTAYAYNKEYVLDILAAEILKHSAAGKEIIPDSITASSLSTHVMEYNDNLEWIKITVDLAAVERAILDPLTTSGIQFGNKVRTAVTGKSIDEAKRIVNNFPEVERAYIDVWPPWAHSLPTIAYNITIRAEN